MIFPNLAGDFAIYTSGFQPDADDVMDPELYSTPVDVAVDNSRNIYIADQTNSDITVFNSYGDFFKKAGYDSVDDSLSILNEPVAVTVDQRGVVYVCDKGDGAIYRFKLSNTLDEDITPED
jgi:streptogramin lyase